MNRLMNRLFSPLNRMLGGRLAQTAMRLAEQAWAVHDFARARAACEAVLALQPDHNDALTLLAYLDLPGPAYRAVIEGIHATVRPRTYVEVGIAAGETLRLARPETRAIGIDPAPIIEEPLGPNVIVLRQTSDEAFASPALSEALAGAPVDLAFIDGMHHCEFALRDFIALERLCGPGATILLHDCYPLNRLTAERDRKTLFWSGDTWRVVLALKKHRPDLAVHVIAAPPTGLAIVRRLDPSSTVLRERYEAVVADMLATDFAVLEGGAKAAALNRCANDWNAVSRLLAA